MQCHPWAFFESVFLSLSLYFSPFFSISKFGIVYDYIRMDEQPTIRWLIDMIWVHPMNCFNWKPCQNTCITSKIGLLKCHPSWNFAWNHVNESLISFNFRIPNAFSELSNCIPIKLVAIANNNLHETQKPANNANRPLKRKQYQT